MLSNQPLAAALHDFLTFLRLQKGAYTDACAGFRRNEISISRQVSRVLKQTGRRLDEKGGVPSAVMTSVTDPTAPDVIVQSIRLSREFLEANCRAGTNEQQLCRALVVFIYTYWEDVTRYDCARALGKEKSDVKLPIAGDLRLLRHAMLHDRNILSATKHAKLEMLGALFDRDAEIVFTHAKMHQIFRVMDKQVAQFGVTALGAPLPPGGLEAVDQIAIGGPRMR